MKNTKRFTWRIPSWIKVLRAFLAWFKEGEVKSDSRSKVQAQNEKVLGLEEFVNESITGLVLQRDRDKLLTEEAEEFLKQMEEHMRVLRMSKKDFEEGGTVIQGNQISKKGCKDVHEITLSMLVNTAVKFKADLLKKNK